MTVTEPNFLAENVVVWVIPYLAYFLGIVIRKTVFPSHDAPPLGHQLLVGIPVALVVVSPCLLILRNAIRQDVPAYLLNLGLIMEQGMVVQEVATRHLKMIVAGVKPADTLLDQSRSAAPPSP